MLGDELSWSCGCLQIIHKDIDDGAEKSMFRKMSGTSCLGTEKSRENKYQLVDRVGIAMNLQMLLAIEAQAL